MKKGVFVVISGPSGVGKDTIVRRLVNDDLGIYSVSMTTRNKRKGEIDGKENVCGHRRRRQGQPYGRGY